MDSKQFTEKVVSLLNAAQQLAAEQSHQQITPLHVAVCMFEDAEGVAPAALRKVAAGPDTAASVLRTLRKQLVRLPAVQTGDAGGDDVYISSDLKRCLQAAQKLQKQQGDSFLGGWVGGCSAGWAEWGEQGLLVGLRASGCRRARTRTRTHPPAPAQTPILNPPGADVLFLAVLGSKDVQAALAEAGVNKVQLAAAVEERRGTMQARAREGRWLAGRRASSCRLAGGQRARFCSVAVGAHPAHAALSHPHNAPTLAPCQPQPSTPRTPHGRRWTAPRRTPSLRRWPSLALT